MPLSDIRTLGWYIILVVALIAWFLKGIIAFAITVGVFYLLISLFARFVKVK